MPVQNKNIRNIAIIAHVDHGKTTLVDKMLRAGGAFRENQVIAERAMSADEVLLRTAAIARGSLESFVVNGAINLEHARDAGMLHLLKRFSTSEKYGDEIEIHDPLRALELLGKANGAFANLRDTFLSKLDVDKLTERQLRALAAGEDVFDVLLNP